MSATQTYKQPVAGDVGLIGVAMAKQAHSDPSYTPRPRIFEEFSLAGRVGVVTGGNGDLGLEMALSLCEAGAVVYCLDMAPTPSTDFQACSELAERFGTELLYRQADVTKPEMLKVVFDEVKEKRGRLDVLVAAAGILGSSEGHDIADFPPDEWRKVVDVNCNGVAFSVSAAVKVMQETHTAGSLILIASMSGSITNRGHKWSAYNASKSAVVQMARSFACELGPDKIRCNSLSPGHIRTNMVAAVLDKKPDQEAKWSDGNPLGRLGAVHELRGVVAWLASDASTYCTGSDIVVAGGHTSW